MKAIKTIKTLNLSLILLLTQLAFSSYIESYRRSSFTVTQISENQASVVDQSTGTKFVGKILDIRGNSIGISKNDICVVCDYDTKSTGKSSKKLTGKVLICKSGKVFENFDVIKGSATGTPPWIAYKNYIGAYYHDQHNSTNNTNSIPGRSRRDVYCLKLS